MALPELAIDTPTLVVLGLVVFIVVAVAVFGAFTLRLRRSRLEPELAPPKSTKDSRAGQPKPSVAEPKRMAMSATGTSAFAPTVTPVVAPAAVDAHDVKEANPVLNLFSKGSLQELRPVLDPQYGVRYPDIENATKIEPRSIPALLEKLAAHGILQAKVSEKIMVCDICSSSNLSARYLCPTCKSINLVRQTSVEHVTCGYTGPQAEFRKKGDLVVCPKCDNEFRPNGPEARVKVGDIQYTCQDCGTSTREPGIFFHCANCEALIPSKGVAFRSLYSYTLERNSNIQSAVLLELASSMLKELGYQVQVPGTLTGRSGLKHKFDLVFSNGETGAVSVVGEPNISNERFLKEFFTSLFDSLPAFQVMIALPSASELARKLAMTNKTQIIEGGDMNTILRDLRTTIVSMKGSSTSPRKSAAVESMREPDRQEAPRP